MGKSNQNNSFEFKLLMTYPCLHSLVWVSSVRKQGGAWIASYKHGIKDTFGAVMIRGTTF